MTTLLAEFTVVGTPIPQGSNRAFIRGGKPRVVANNQGPLEKWRGDIRSACRQYESRLVDVAVRDRLSARNPDFSGIEPHAGPVSVRLEFYLPRPKSHYLGATKSRPVPQLRPEAPTWAPGGKDLDKLVRAVLDALTGVLYVDDSQVVVVGATKQYSATPGVDVRVSAL